MSVKVSIIMLTYNHSNFIRQALESVLLQNVNFTYELLVGDDCSPDNTQEIIRQMEPMFEGRMKPILREKNLGAAANGADLLSRAAGEYLAFLEGDDFWTEPDKLQRQVDFLDTHPDVMACYHKSMQVDADNNVIYERMPEFTVVGEFTIEHYNQFLIPGQTGTVMMRKEIIFVDDISLPRLRCTPGDRLIPLAAMRKGKIYCSDDVMSAYRSVVNSSHQSWSKKYGMDNLFGNYYFFRMHREMEKVGHAGGLNVDMRQPDSEMFYNMLVHTFFWKQVPFILLVIYMLLIPSHRLFMLRNGGRQFWQEGVEKVKHKLRRNG